MIIALRFSVKEKNYGHTSLYKLVMASRLLKQTQKLGFFTMTFGRRGPLFGLCGDLINTAFLTIRKPQVHFHTARYLTPTEPHGVGVALPPLRLCLTFA